jgi:hypothetical protein
MRMNDSHVLNASATLLPANTAGCMCMCACPCMANLIELPF